MDAAIMYDLRYSHKHFILWYRVPDDFETCLLPKVTYKVEGERTVCDVTTDFVSLISLCPYVCVLLFHILLCTYAAFQMYTGNISHA
jgi:hypothetical protein